MMWVCPASSVHAVMAYAHSVIYIPVFELVSCTFSTIPICPKVLVTIMIACKLNHVVKLRVPESRS